MTQISGIDLVGPNAILQSIEVMRDRCGDETVAHVVTSAGLRGFLDFPPKDMVPAHEAKRLLVSIEGELTPKLALDVARESGRRTGEYILAHRIPRPAQWVLRCLPPRLSGPLLLKAICRHSWTFAGNAVVSYQAAEPMELAIHDNPLAVMGCAWHHAVFEVLFHRLVSPAIAIEHPACCTNGGKMCRFLFHRP